MPVDMRLAHKCVTLLNEMIKADPVATERLCNARVKCNSKLSEHPTIQVGPEPTTGHSGDVVGLLGVLNGLCGCYDDGPREGWGAVALVFDEDTKAPIEARLLTNSP